MRHTAIDPEAAASPERPRLASRTTGPIARLGRVAVVGNPDGRRVGLLREAVAALGGPAPAVLPYADLLAGRSDLAEVVEPGMVLRIESPDRDFGVERAILALGADAAEQEGTPSRVSREEALGLEFDRGRIRHSRQWYLGFRALLAAIDRRRAACPPHRVMNEAADIAAMFDKPGCIARFRGAGVPCPEGIGTPAGYDDLRARMDRAGMDRVFLKLAHGSSASGVLALRAVGRRVRASTTAELARCGGEDRLYNSRTIRAIDSEPEVVAVVDAICREGAYAERWIPKAGLPGGTFDLRVVVIAGCARHVVARVSRSPMTNLHLLNRRGDPSAVRSRMGEDAWRAALLACERAAALFPGSLYAGVDLAITSDFRRHAVLEINAFGDLLPGVTDRGVDTYTAELLAMAGRPPGEAP